MMAMDRLEILSLVLLKACYPHCTVSVCLFQPPPHGFLVHFDFCFEVPFI